jgi:AcrR family transcriptional regulator
MFAGVNIGLMESSETGKRGYHHGDLRNALVAAAAELAANGGPASVTIRAAAREVGVTPTAAYRHFGGHEELLKAAKDCALEELNAAMHKEIAARTGKLADPVLNALARLGALGQGYISFARAQPGLFRTVFSPGGSVMPQQGEEASPFLALLHALDDLVKVGYLPEEHRPMAELAAWSTVHGLAALLDGPLRDLPIEVQDEAVVQSMLTLAHGLRGNGLTLEQQTVLTEEFTARR